MTWTQEPGGNYIAPSAGFVFRLINQANQQLADHKGKLDVVIVDACHAKQYQQGRTVLVTNNWLAPGELDESRYQQFPNSWYGLYAEPIVYEPQTPTKKFNCFMNRMDPIRQSWLYQLIRLGIFDQGLISFNMDIGAHMQFQHCDPDDTPYTVFEKQFARYHSEMFGTEHEFIKSQVPYRNFSVPLDQAIMQTEFSIVLETYFDRNELITFSEKIFRCLKLPRPWVVFAMKNAVAYLRDMGFDVLDDLVDHSYDSVNFAMDRQLVILDQIKTLCQQTLTPAQIVRCQQAATHNQLLLTEFYGRFYQDVNNACQQAVTKCLKLF
jgi:hypothetical protein